MKRYFEQLKENRSCIFVILMFSFLTDLYSFGIILFAVNLSLRLSNSWRIGFRGCSSDC